MAAKETIAPNWEPTFRYVWTRKELQAWIDAYGLWTFRDGVRWQINSKHVMAGRYDVWFTPY